MLRIVLFYILPFLLPFIGFFTYRFLVTRGQARVRETPWFVLTIAGLGLAIGTLVTVALTGGGDKEADYQPPRIEDGRIVPGEIMEPIADPVDDSNADPDADPAAAGDDATAGADGG